MSEARSEFDEPAAEFEYDAGDEPRFKVEDDVVEPRFAGSASGFDSDDANSAGAGADAANPKASAEWRSERGPLLRNFLVATATIPFVFLLVLIASIFVLDSTPERLPVEALDPASLDVDPVTLTVDEPAASGTVESLNDSVADEKPVIAQSLVGPRLEDFKIELPFDGVVRSVGIDGDRLALLVGAADGDRVVVYDVAHGTPLVSLPIVHGDGTDAPASTSGVGQSASKSDASSGEAAPFVASRSTNERRENEEGARESDEGALTEAQRESAATSGVVAPTLKAVARTIAEARAELDESADVAPQPTDIDGL